MSHTVNLNELANGAVQEKFDREVQKVMENIADPNTDFKKKRKIQVTLTFQADEQRDIAAVEVEAKSTLAPSKGVMTKFVLDQDSDGKVIGQELKSGVKGQTYVDDNGEIYDDRGQKIEAEKDNRVVDFKAQGGQK